MSNTVETKIIHRESVPFRVSEDSSVKLLLTVEDGKVLLGCREWDGLAVRVIGEADASLVIRLIVENTSTEVFRSQGMELHLVKLDTDSTKGN